MAWRTETLLAILRGEPFDKAAFGSVASVASVANLVEETVGSVERVSSRLFRAPFEDAVVSALEEADDALKANAFTRVSAWRMRVNDATPENTDVSLSRACGKGEDAYRTSYLQSDDANALLREIFADPAPFVPPAFEVSALPRRHEDALARSRRRRASGAWRSRATPRCAWCVRRDVLRGRELRGAGDEA